MKRRKGLSPLIAAVILIAATMTIAGILALWVSNYMTSELIRAEEAGITGGTRCLGAEFELHSGRLVSNQLTLIVNNKRSIDLDLTYLYLIAPNNELDTVLINETLRGNEIKSLLLPITKPNFLTGEIKTNCPDVSAYFTRDQITVT